MRSHWIRALLTKPRRTGAIAPSSPALALHLAKASLDDIKADCIIDIGAGTGIVSQHLAMLDSNINIIAVEPCDAMANALRTMSAVSEVFEGTFEDNWQHILRRFQTAILISSVPLYSLKNTSRNEYLGSILKAINSGKVLRCLQYSYLPFLPWRDAREAFIGHRSFVVQNIPPAWIWRKNTIQSRYNETIKQAPCAGRKHICSTAIQTNDTLKPSSSHTPQMEHHARSPRCKFTNQP